MFDHRLAFEQPAYLALLAVLPLAWWWGRRSLAALGRWRRRWALGLRCAVIALLVLALAEAYDQQRSDRLSVVFVLDQSLSIPAEQRQAMLAYVNRAVTEHRDQQRGDRFAVIVFGREAEVEVPLVATDLALRSRVESLLDGEYTDLATALQRAKAIFPHDAAKRIVLISDGNQNRGDAYREARTAAGAGVSIDVTPVLLPPRTEASVEKVDVPAAVRRGQPFEVRVVLSNEAPAGAERPLAGKLRVVRKAGDLEELVAEQDVVVEPGKRVFAFPETIDRADFFTYEARFSPADPQADGMTQNNAASAFTHVSGRGQVLLVENYERPGEFAALVASLQREEIQVEVVSTNRLFDSLADLQRYDAVVLANVPRSSGADADSVASFSDEQIRMLVQNTRELGCGLVMIGGPDAYGAGGWANTELEAAMPVDFQIKNAKVVPVGALALMMHAGEMPQANYWQKRIAIESIKLLGGRDYCGLVQWNGVDQWLWGAGQGGMIRVGPSRRMMLAKVDQMAIGDMPAFDPAMRMAAAAFAGLADAAVKHMIIISDGDPSPAAPGTLAALKQQGVKVTTVAVASHGALGSAEMRRIATATGGKYYEVRSSNALPKIYQREARQVARPLVFEPNAPLPLQQVAEHEMLSGLSGGPPPIRGYVLTTVKQNPLVEVLLRAPEPTNPDNSAVLAAWTYGAGKAVALTTDAGTRWASSWTAWEGYDKFFQQVVRWAMRPTGDSGGYAVATDVRDGKTQVVISALDPDEQFLNNQAISATAVGPDMSQTPVVIRQTAPGRYVGEFPSELPGSYLLVVNPGGGTAPIRTGVSVGYSAEYRDRETNLALLQSIAKLPAAEGAPGTLVEEGLAAALEAPELAHNPFRRDLPPVVASQPLWPWLLATAACLFWGDVFVRRVQVPWDRAARALARVRDWALRRQPAVAAPETLSRLRSRKAEVGAELEGRRAARYAPTDQPRRGAADGGQATPPAAAPPAAAATPTQPSKPTQPAAPKAPPGADEAPESYTERLLKAKQQVWRDRQPPPERPDPKGPPTP